MKYDIKITAKMEPVRQSATGNTIYESELRFQNASEVHDILRNSRTLGHWHKENGFGDDYYRVVWVNLLDRRILTYCEGDLTLVEASCTQLFYRELNDLAKFYLSN